MAPLIIVRPEAYLGVYRRLPLNATAADEAEALEEAMEDAAEAARFLEMVAQGHYKVNATAFTFKGEYDPNDRWSKKQIANVDHEGFNPDYHMVLGGYNKARCGEATSPGKWGNTYDENPLSECGVRTICHEHIHQLGVQHSGRIGAITHKLRQYGDTTCVMGYGAAWYGLSAPKVWQLGWYTPREIGTIDGAGTFTVTPLELEERDLLPDEYRFLYIPYERVIISLRKSRKGYPYELPNPPERLYVYWYEKDTGFTYRFEPDMYPGDSLNLLKGTVIKYQSYDPDNERAEVEVSTSWRD